MRFMTGYASTPGRFRLDFRTWARCFPFRATAPLLPLLLFGIVAGALYWTTGAPLQAALTLCFMGLIAGGPLIRPPWQKCWRGNVNPAVVISVNPYLIAVSADMGRRTGDAWPVIKILSQPLHRIHGPRPQIGDRLPTVSLYSGTEIGPHWRDFSPTAIACLTDNPTVVQEAMRRLEVNEFGPDHWQELEQNLARVPTPYKPGLYWMRSK